MMKAGAESAWRMEMRAWRLRRKTEFKTGKSAKKKISHLFGGVSATIADLLLRGIIGYGYRSFWAVRWLSLVRLAWMLLYYAGFQAGSIVPHGQQQRELHTVCREPKCAARIRGVPRGSLLTRKLLSSNKAWHPRQVGAIAGHSSCPSKPLWMGRPPVEAGRLP